MQAHDDDLARFEAEGALPLPESTVEREGAGIWYASYGAGPPVVLLHGGLGHSGNWGHQLSALLGAGRRVILVDSRGHGRSTRDARPFSYDLMADDLRAVLDALSIDRAPMIGWSDGACTALVLASQAPDRVAGVFFFGCNMDPGGTKEIDDSNPLLGRCFRRHAADYARLSATPDEFQSFVAAVSQMMETEPNYTAADLAAIAVPVTIVQAESDEFIRPDHAEYLARTIPGAELVVLPGVSHFAPLQRPGQFNEAVAAFLRRLPD